MVRLEGVGLDYGTGPSKTAVLQDLTFEVPEGGFRWLLGPSGAGKTSLLRLLNLTALPSHGRLNLLGQEIPELARADFPPIRRRIGMVFQDFRLLPHLSAYDNVALPLRIAGRPEGQIRVDVVELLSWVGLSRKLASRPAELSGGEQQRVAIARAVVARPLLLLADEPTGNLDEAQAERLMQLLHEMNRLGTTVFVATHNATLVQRHPAHTLRLLEGHLVRDD
ncbi:MAG: ATP-binding cassette domain-containing protein [Acetobacteraceae bacterium]|nr:ATP-binding cassette domain-containing protein [Acetobacteraceae bacterium]